MGASYSALARKSIAKSAVASRSMSSISCQKLTPHLQHGKYWMLKTATLLGARTCYSETNWWTTLTPYLLRGTHVLVLNLKWAVSQTQNLSLELVLETAFALPWSEPACFLVSSVTYAPILFPTQAPSRETCWRAKGPSSPGPARAWPSSPSVSRWRKLKPLLPYLLRCSTWRIRERSWLRES